MEVIFQYLKDNAGLIFTTLLGFGAVTVYANRLAVVNTAITKLLVDFNAAIADGKLDESELIKIVQDAKDIPQAIKDIFKKR